jgi:PEGA domain
LRALTTLRAVALLTCWSAAAAAAEPATAEPADGPRREAAERFDRGLALFEEGNNSAALAEFLAADALVHSPVVRLNVGLVYAAMGQAVAAVDTLSALLPPSSGLDDAQRERARKAVEEQSARIGRLLVTCNVAGAKIDVDAARAGVTPLEAVRVAAGSHIVTVSANGFGSERREVLVASGVTVPVAIELTAIPVAVPVPAIAPVQPLARVPRVAPVEKAPTSNSQATWGWVSIVVGGVAATTGGVWLGVNANHRAQAKAEYDSFARKADAHEAPCNTNAADVPVDPCNAENDRVTANYKEARERTDVPAFVGLGVGVAAIGIGIVLLLTADHPHRTSAALTRSAFVRPLGTRGALLSVSF